MPVSQSKPVGTVGAVACDLNGNLAAATSTGGMTNKKFGRVGDTPIIGAGTWAGQKVKRLPIAFSTLGCPNWEWKRILDQAAQHGYSALELRGVAGQMDLPKSPQFIGAKLQESLKDLDAAARFYEGLLGLKRVATEGSEAIVYESGRDTPPRRIGGIRIAASSRTMRRHWLRSRKAGRNPACSRNAAGNVTPCG